MQGDVTSRRSLYLYLCEGYTVPNVESPIFISQLPVPGIEPVPPASEAGVVTTTPPLYVNAEREEIPPQTGGIRTVWSVFHVAQSCGLRCS